MPSAQEPIASGFGPEATADDVIKGRDLSGKVAIVTGGYAGLGLETARVLAKAGATVVVPARDPEKAKQALSSLPGVIQESIDLIEPMRIDGFAERFLAKYPALHILVNNAAVMASPLTRDARGYELQLSTNHLGHFQLTQRLWPALLKANGARVVCVSSRGHCFGGVDFHDPNFNNRTYDPWVAYGQSKTANALFALALDQLGEEQGVRAFSLHPGGILATDLSRHSYSADRLRAMGYIDEKGTPIIDPANNKKTIPQGAATQVWCATSPTLDGMGGVYCENSNIAKAESGDSKELLGVRPWARDPEHATRLWALSEELIGIEFR